MRISENFVLNVARDFNVVGNFFRIETAASNIDVDFYRGGQVLPENLRSASAGYWANPDGGFDRVVITSSATQAVSVDVYRGRVGADRVAGSVSVSAGPSGAHVPAAKAITNVSAQILAANAARKYLLLQNHDAANDLYVRCDGAAATADAACLRIPPGGVWEPSFVPTGEVRGIRAVASAGNNVHAIEG